MERNGFEGVPELDSNLVRGDVLLMSGKIEFRNSSMVNSARGTWSRLTGLGPVHIFYSMLLSKKPG